MAIVARQALRQLCLEFERLALRGALADGGLGPRGVEQHRLSRRRLRRLARLHGRQLRLVMGCAVISCRPLYFLWIIPNEKDAERAGNDFTTHD